LGRQAREGPLQIVVAQKQQASLPFGPAAQQRGKGVEDRQDQAGADALVIEPLTAQDRGGLIEVTAIGHEGGHQGVALLQLAAHRPHAVVGHRQRQGQGLGLQAGIGTADVAHLGPHPLRIQVEG
ncbi:MAG: hypothetical protein ACK56I_11085, partial [bacterium]